MRSFDYARYADSRWDSEVLGLVAQIHEFKGRQELYLKQKPAVLDKLVEVAKIQSTEASNKIEGIVTTSTRVKELYQEKTTPRNRDEEEIMGYRDVLNTIHESYEYIPLRSSYILQLHRDLYQYSEKAIGGRYKNTQNYIAETHPDGTQRVRFTPLAPYETPDAVEAICESFNRAVDAALANYSFTDAIPGVKITSSGNKLTLSTTEPILSPKTSSPVKTRSGAAGGKGAVAVWRTSDRTFQDFATYNAAGGDPVSCYIKVKTDAVGSAGLQKISEDGKVSGIQFQITGSDGSSVTKTTDANGNIDMAGMPIYAADGSKITYTATEINVPNRYVKPQSQTFQLTEGQTATIQFENKLKRWRVTVTKADSKTGGTPQGNGSLKGATFGVYQGNALVKEYTVGDDLTFTTDYFPYGEDWTLKEISAGEGYKVSTVVTDLCEIPAGSNDEFNDNEVTVTNEPIRGGISVEKRDSKTGAKPQGDANFAGIVFEIINNSTNPVEVDGKVVARGAVAKEITTNAQGFATTGPNCLPYGDYIIREKSTNASMRKTFTDEIPVTISEEGKVYPFTAENDVVRGGLAVQKRDSQTGETPQGNADFSQHYF